MAGAVPDARAGRQASPPPYREPPCRNCGAPAGETYCPRCGQETASVLPSARSFLRDAAGRYVALDGRLWRTLAALMFRPGFLTHEYLDGRRRRYVRPARLFLVLSLLMFATIRVVVGVPTIEDGAVVADAVSEPAAAPSGTADATNTRARAQAEVDPEVVVLPGVALSVDDEGMISIVGAGPIAAAVRQRMERFNALPRQERFE